MYKSVYDFEVVKKVQDGIPIDMVVLGDNSCFRKGIYHVEQTPLGVLCELLEDEDVVFFEKAIDDAKAVGDGNN